MSQLRHRKEEYFHWLTDKINISSEPGRDYFKVCRALHMVYFTPILENDQNREVDGLVLRKEYFGTLDEGPCTMLEMIISLVFHMDHEADHSQNGLNPTYWFFEILGNLGLEGCRDECWNEETHEELFDAVLEACETINFRLYGPDGKGGLFPLKDTHYDARDTELYFQMTQYMYENYY